MAAKKLSQKSLLKAVDASIKSATTTETGRTHPFYEFKPFDTLRDGRPHPQKAFFHSETRLSAVISGGRSGKTYAGQQKVRCLALGIDPSRPGYRYPIDPGTQSPFVIWYICPPDTVRKQLDDLARGFPMSVKKKVHYSAGKEMIVGEPTPERPNGWEIHVKSRQKGLEQFQYAIVHVVVYDEEPPEEIWVECQQRLVSTNGWTIITLTPVYGSTWLYQKLHSLSKEFENATTGKFGWYSWPIHENPTLSREAIADFEKEIKDEDEYAIRILGEFRTLAGDRYFPVEVIREQAKYTREPCATVSFSSYGKPLVEEYRGQRSGLFLFKPIEEIRANDVFVIGADPSHGIGKDASVAQILNVMTLEQVAVFRDNSIEPWDFGVELAYMHRFFNSALVMPEMNIEGNAVFRGLRAAGCGRIGTRFAYGGKKDEKEDNYGWLTGRHNKHPAFQELLVSMRDKTRGKLGVTICDQITLDELDGIWHLRDKRHGSHGIGAISREGHDDHAMALIIALQAVYQAPKPQMFASPDFGTDVDRDIAKMLEQERRRDMRLRGLANPLFTSRHRSGSI